MRGIDNRQPAARHRRVLQAEFGNGSFHAVRLRSHRPVVKLDGKNPLPRAMIMIQNLGGRSATKFSFEIKGQGTHTHIAHQVAGEYALVTQFCVISGLGRVVRICHVDRFRYGVLDEHTTVLSLRREIIGHMSGVKVSGCA